MLNGVLLNDRDDKKVWLLENDGTCLVNSFSFMYFTRSHSLPLPNKYHLANQCFYGEGFPPPLTFVVFYVRKAQHLRVFCSTSLSLNWCVMCKNSDESLILLLFFCPFVASCWEKLFNLINVVWCFPSSALDALLQLLQGQARIIRDNDGVALLWRLL